MLHIYVKKINVFVAISPAAWSMPAWSLPSVDYCCGHWTTSVVIELKQNTQNTQTKNTVSSIRFSTDPPILFQEKSERESFPFCYISQANISAITGLFQIEK